MIEIKDLSFAYHSKTKRILDRLTCDLEEGFFVAILGQNGAGKSTLLKCLNKTLRPNGGAAFIDERRAASWLGKWRQCRNAMKLRASWFSIPSS